MDFYVYNEADLAAALASGYPDKNIEISAPFKITTTHVIMSGANIVTMASSIGTIALTRDANFNGEMFRVDPSTHFTIRNIVLDGNKQQAGITESMVSNHGILDVFDATLRNNSSFSNGGAIHNFGELNMRNSNFLNNHSEGRGGAICCHGRTNPVHGVTFTSNTTNNEGGAIFYDAPHDLMFINTRFERNTAMNGGALNLVRRDAMVRFDINERSTLIGNRATQDGGAIWVSDLDALNTQLNVTFTNNRAAQGYLIDPSDIPMHNTHIHSTIFTSPFQYGYNNFDINYTRGEPYIEEKGCEVVGTQTVDLCVPVTVKPSAVVGITKVRCCGAAVITPGTNICPGVPSADCSFTISQKLCIEVPVEFNAEVTSGETHVGCGTPSGNTTCNELCRIPMEANEEMVAEEILPDE